jgi:hypothetical protein
MIALTDLVPGIFQVHAELIAPLTFSSRRKIGQANWVLHRTTGILAEAVALETNQRSR